ncbi:unnamed protein product [Chrysoparadoxa australica]
MLAACCPLRYRGWEATQMCPAKTNEQGNKVFGLANKLKGIAKGFRELYSGGSSSINAAMPERRKCLQQREAGPESFAQARPQNVLDIPLRGTRARSAEGATASPVAATSTVAATSPVAATSTSTSTSSSTSPTASRQVRCRSPPPDVSRCSDDAGQPISTGDVCFKPVHSARKQGQLIQSELVHPHSPPF